MILQNNFNGTFSLKIRLSDQEEPSQFLPLIQKSVEAQGYDISLTFRNGVRSFICGILLILSFLVLSVTFSLDVGRFETSNCRNRVLAEITLWKNTMLFKCVWQWLYSKNAWPLKYFKFTVSQFQASLGES